MPSYNISPFNDHEQHLIVFWVDCLLKDLKYEKKYEAKIIVNFLQLNFLKWFLEREVEKRVIGNTIFIETDEENISDKEVEQIKEYINFIKEF